jgi:hypothetical protein
MLSHSFAAAQIARMTGLRGFPTAPAAVEELIVAIQHAWSEDDARKVVDDWLVEVSWTPTPADLRRLLFRSVASQPCEACDGTGWRVQEYLGDYSTDGITLLRAQLLHPAEADEVKRKMLKTQAIITGVTRCMCAHRMTND